MKRNIFYVLKQSVLRCNISIGTSIALLLTGLMFCESIQANGPKREPTVKKSIEKRINEQSDRFTVNYPYPMPKETNVIPDAISEKDLLAGFRTPPNSIKTGVYWYWISSNISCEGVVKDLQAMKKAGINRAYIGDIGVDNVKRGAIKTLSDDWWKVIHTALKTATELDIEIGIFNSPGWSQSGGPWVNNERAMRYLTGSIVCVSGPKKIVEKLPLPAKEFQDVKVLAWPEPKEFNTVFSLKNGRIQVQPKVLNADNLIDGKLTTAIFLPDKKECIIDFMGKENFKARSLTIQTTETPIVAHCVLQAKIDKTYKTISTFEINRSNPELHVGFRPYAPIVVSFPAIASKEFRLIVKSDRAKSGLTELTLSASPRIEQYSEKTLAKMHQTPHPMWSEYQWRMPDALDDPQTVTDSKQVIDLSDKMDRNGVLTWDVPDGNWIVLRTGMTPTGTKNAPAVPEATGYETDKMSRKHIQSHFDALMGEVIRRIPEKDRKSFKVVVQDSYEVGGQNFTDQFCQKFQSSFGYDPTPFLPAFFGYIVGSPLESDRFLWDLRRFIADEVAYSYVGGLRDASNRFGLTTWLECYGHWGFPGEFLQYGGQSDEIGGEYWSEGSLGDIENRIASSCGHIYGKKSIWSESNTCAGKPFGRSPVDMKLRTDRFFSEGINSTLLHLYIQQPNEKKPGINAWFGNEFNRHNTWFSQLDLFTTYLKRCNFILQQGINVADIAYFIGEDAPKMTGTVEPALPRGFQYDFINAEVLLSATKVQNGLLTLPHGTQYRVLVLPPQTTMRPALLRKIDQLVRDGAVVLGPKPTRSPSLAGQPKADQEVQKIADQLWGKVDGKSVKYRKVGKGIIVSGMSLEDLFAIRGTLPDCQGLESAPLVFGHRHLTDREIYFVANQSDKKIDSVPVEFRITGKIPEIWLPADGSKRTLNSWKSNGRTTTVPLTFVPQESYFIVFAKATQSRESSGTNFPAAQKTVDLKGPWTVRFDSDPIARGPKESVTFDRLENWAQSKDSRIRFFSGTAQYSTTFDLPTDRKSESIILSLGDVAEMAKVLVNGKYAGGVWTLPYRIDITQYVKKGKNTITIEVVNTWVNRLIGDQELPEAKRPTWSPVNSWQKDSPLKKSGLLGPVQIEYILF